MGIEQRAEAQRRVSIQLGPLNLPLKEDFYVNFTDSLEDKVYEAARVRFLPGVKEQIAQTARGHFLIVYANHESLYDGRVLGKATRQVLNIANEFLPEDQQYKGFILPKATSIDSGDQDPLIRKYSEDHIKAKMARDRLYTIDYTREKDQEKYNLPSNTLSFFKELKQHIRSNYGIAVFPEATVQGGRNMNRGKIDPRIKIFGMQHFEEKTMGTMARLVMNEGLSPVFLPIGIYGTFRIISPDKLNIPTTTIARAIFPGLPLDLAKVTVGTPIRWDEMVEPASINNFLASHLAHLVPESARGAFRDNT